MIKSLKKIEKYIKMFKKKSKKKLTDTCFVYVYFLNFKEEEDNNYTYIAPISKFLFSSALERTV